MLSDHRRQANGSSRTAMSLSALCDNSLQTDNSRVILYLDIRKVSLVEDLTNFQIPITITPQS